VTSRVMFPRRTNSKLLGPKAAPAERLGTWVSEDHPRSGFYSAPARELFLIGSMARPFDVAQKEPHTRGCLKR